MLRMQDIMNTNVKTVTEGVSADDAFDRMKRQEVHHLVVVKDRDVIGIISQRDLGGRRGNAVRRGRTVGDLMVEHAVTAKPTDTIRQAANKLRGYGIGCLPIVDDGKLKGIVTITDLLELIGRGVERPVEQGKRYTLRRKEGKHRPYNKP